MTQRDCRDQVLSLTAYVENVFERKRSVSSFVDLSAALDSLHGGNVSKTHQGRPLHKDWFFNKQEAKKSPLSNLL